MNKEALRLQQRVPCAIRPPLARATILSARRVSQGTGRLPRAAGLILAAVLSGQVLAATDQDFAELKQQLLELKTQYEQRIQALERRLEQAERNTAISEIGRAHV